MMTKGRVYSELVVSRTRSPTRSLVEGNPHARHTRFVRLHRPTKKFGRKPCTETTPAKTAAPAPE
jgi:hypothetical protein